MKKKPIAIAYSDCHFNIWNQFNEGNRRVKDVIQIQKILKLESLKLRVPILFMGDLFQNEKTISNKLLSMVLPHFKKMWGDTKSITYAISGNHDQSEENTLSHSSPSYVDTLSKVFPGLVCMDFKSEKLTGFNIHGIPYLTHDLGFNKAIKNIKLTKGSKNILMIHTTLPKSKDTDGREMQTETISKKTLKLLEKFDLVLTGHIHMPMKLGNNIVQIGATNQQRKTDKDSDLGYWVIYEDFSTKFISLDFPKFIELNYGEEKPDNKNFYYNKPKIVEINVRETDSKKFSDINDRTKLAKNYINQSSAKVPKRYKETLIDVLKKAE